MKELNFNRKQLASYILNSAEDSVVEKIKDMIEKEESIVGFTTYGEPLTKEEYKSHIKKISNEVKNGAKTYTSDEIKDAILNGERRK